MKKTTLAVLSILVVLTLTACGAASNDPQADPAKLTDSYADAISVSSQLLVGAFELEGTDLAVTPEQAGELLPLWQVLQSLSASDSTAQAEMDALVDQIEETMTPEQIQAIKAMNLTQEDMFAMLQERGLGGQGGSAVSGGGTMPVPPTGSDGQPYVPGSGGGPGGGGGFGGGQGQGLTPEQIATAQARRAEEGGGLRLLNTPAPLIEALIQLLEDRAAE